MNLAQQLLTKINSHHGHFRKTIPTHQRREGLHCRTRSERRQYAKGTFGLWNPGQRLQHRGRDVCPYASNAGPGNEGSGF